MSDDGLPQSAARRTAAFVAVATFAAAHDVAEAIAARRRGEHPSEMRAEADLRRDVAAAAEACDGGWRALVRGVLVLASDLDAADDATDAIDDDAPGVPDAGRLAATLLTAQRLARDARRLHQHLLGLAAVGVAVDAGLPDAARDLSAVASGMAHLDTPRQVRALADAPAPWALDGRVRRLVSACRRLGEGAE